MRPSARIIPTVGEYIIKDSYAAIAELVKNAYDADASKVIIEFTTYEDNGEVGVKIIIKDDGHGMDLDSVINKWMVPATNNKLKRKYSPKGRLLQGRKGIGKYSVSILGHISNIETVDINGNQTLLYIDWRDFEIYDYLDDVELTLVTGKVNKPSGTTFTILGNRDKLYEWDDEQLNLLINELKKLLIPIELQNNSIDFREDLFSIILKFSNFPSIKYNNMEYILEPYPVLELYDYRLYGEINSSGNAYFVFENKVLSNIPDEIINTQIEMSQGESYCGAITLDLRVFDRDHDSLDNLIQKGLKDSITGNYLNKLEAKRLLNEISGIGIYRDKFRIRPYGDNGYDWMELDKHRVQNPSLKLGSNQISGFVWVESEEQSNLVEKSARDGLKENIYFKGLKKIVQVALIELETRRYNFRRKTGRGRKNSRLERDLNNLFDFSYMTEKITNVLYDSHIEERYISQITDVIRKEEDEKSNLLESIRNTIAIYQGQVTLGKIIMVLLHESSKPLSWFKNQPRVMMIWIEKLKNGYNAQAVSKIDSYFEDLKIHTEQLIGLFNRINPLAAKKRSKRKEFNVNKLLENCYKVFEHELMEKGIRFEVVAPLGVTFKGWEEDFYIITTNMIENSIYWLSTSKKEDKFIQVIIRNNGNLVIDIIDNGPGIDKIFVEDKDIFEPGFTTKPDGTGLGLSIAGEAAERNGGELKALDSNEGAYFRLEFSYQKED